MKPQQPCGSHAAFNRHKAAGERPCEACVLGERTYQRIRARRRRAQPTQVDGQRPLMTTVPGLPITPECVISNEVRQISRALSTSLPGLVVSFTREHGLRVHTDMTLADAWISAAPMVDDDAAIYHLPTWRTG